MEWNLRNATIAILVCIIVGGTIWIIAPLFPVLITAISFCIFVSPLVDYFSKYRFSNRKVAAVIVLLITLLGIGVPIATFSREIIKMVSDLSSEIIPFIDTKLLPKLDVPFPEWVPFATEIGPINQTVAENIGQIIESGMKGVINFATPMTKGVLMGVINFFVFIYSSFFFLVKGEEMFKSALSSFPLSESDHNLFQGKIVGMIRSLFKSILIIGVLQAVLIGIAFRFAGIPDPLLWASLIILTSAIPGLGAPAVWWPVVIYLFFNGQTGWAIIMILWCGLIAGTVDNVLRPRIIGSETKVNDLYIFLATLGGILAFGPLGLFVGPFLLAVSIATMSIFRKTMIQEQTKD